MTDYYRPWESYNYVQLNSATVKNGEKLYVGDQYYLPEFIGSTPQKLTVARITSSNICEAMIWSVEEKTWSNGKYIFKAEKTETPEGRYIVCLEENGNFEPTVTSKEYTTRSRADKVAIEMAEKYDGVFYVLQVVGRTELKKKAEITNL